MENTSRTVFFTLFLGSLTIYILTLAPTITWQNSGVDSGDFATAVAVNGVPHPPGYPTYLLLGELFELIPAGDVAYRLNLLSATCAAMAAALAGLIIIQTLLPASAMPAQTGEALPYSRHLIWLCAVAAALTLAFSNIYWSQAIIAEVYALNVLFAAVLLFGALKLQPANEKWLLPLLAWLLGVSLGNHLSILLFLPAVVLNLKVRWRRRQLSAAGAAFCSGLMVYLIIPWRASSLPPLNWGMATTWPNFVWLVSAQAYRQFLFDVPQGFVPARIGVELRLVGRAFLWWGVPVGLLGLYRLGLFNRRLAAGSLISFLLISIYAIGYNTGDSYVYLLPALLLFVLWIGWGLYDIGTALQQTLASKFGWGSYIGGVILCLPLFSLLLNFSNQDLSRDYEACHYARQSLQSASPESIILTDDDPHTFALWYGRYGLALRPDVAVVSGNLLAYDWYRQSLRQTHPDLRLENGDGQPLTTLPVFIAQNLPHSPIYSTATTPPELTGYRWVSRQNLYQVKEQSSE